MSRKSVLQFMLYLTGILGIFAVSYVFAAGIGDVANTAKNNLGNVAKLFTAGAYIAGMGFGIAALVKFKAHKDNPTQIHISQPIALLFVAAALLFLPGVFVSTGGTLFSSGQVSNISGFTSF